MYPYTIKIIFFDDILKKTCKLHNYQEYFKLKHALRPILSIIDGNYHNYEISQQKNASVSLRHPYL